MSKSIQVRDKQALTPKAAFFNRRRGAKLKSEGVFPFENSKSRLFSQTAGKSSVSGS